MRQKKSLICEELEPRLLFSAGLEGILLDDSNIDSDTAIVETVTDSEAEILLASSNQTITTDSSAHEVVFISQDIDNFDQLVEDLAGQDHIDVYILDDGQDGIEQISSVLAGYQDLSAVHLISHGNSSALQLGNGSLSADNLLDYQDAIASWQTALSEQADLLLYGCNLASGAAGQALVSGLQNLTGADVAASDDLTGQAALGGDWELEYQSGEIETAVVFSTQVQSNWNGVLPNPSITRLAGDTLAYSEGDGAQVIEQGSNISVNNGGNTYQSLTISISGGGNANEDVLSIRNQGRGVGQIGFDGTNISFEGNVFATASATNTGLNITFDNSANNPSIAALLENITYENINTDNPDTSTRTIDFRLITDAPAWSSTPTLSVMQQASVDVSAVNDAPVNNLPGTQTTPQNSALVFSNANSNAISITDVDAGNNSIRVSLLVNIGTLSLNGTTGLTFVPGGGDGIDDSAMTFTGTVEDINAALDGMIYTTPANTGGSDTLLVTTQDLGNTGGGNLAAFGYTSINISGINGSPVIGGTSNATVTADDCYCFIPNVTDDSSTLTYSITNKPSWASFDSSTGELLGTPGPSDVGTTAGIVISVSDGYYSAALPAFDLTVTPAEKTASSDGLILFELEDVTSIDAQTSETILVDNFNKDIPDDTSEDDVATVENNASEATEDSIADADFVLTVDDEQTVKLIDQIEDRVLMPELSPELNGDAATDPNAHRQVKHIPAGADRSLDLPQVQSFNQNSLQFELKLALEELNRSLGVDGQAQQVGDNVMVTTATGLSIALTAGFINWALKGQSLAAAFLSAIPSWNAIDPTPAAMGAANGLHATMDHTPSQQQKRLDSIFNW